MNNLNGFVIEKGVLKKYKGEDAVVVVPDGVKSIAEHAFDNSKSLMSVTIPDSVTRIGWSAFAGCTGLKKAEIGNGVKRIEEKVFSGCNGLESITIGNCVKRIEAFAFFGCSGLTSVTIPDGVTIIGRSAFENCTGLASVTFPASLISVGEEAFKDCENIKTIELPEGVASIGSGAFYCCKKLEELVIPQSLTYFGVDALLNCSALRIVRLPAQFVNGIKAPHSFVVVARANGTDRILTYGWKGEKGKRKTETILHSYDAASSLFWREYDSALLNTSKHNSITESEKLIGAAGRLLAPTELTPENEAAYVQLIKNDISRVISCADTCGLPSVVRMLFDRGFVNTENEADVRWRLRRAKTPEIRAMADEPIVSDAGKDVEKDPIVIEYEKKIRKLCKGKIRKELDPFLYELPGDILQEFRFKDGTQAPGTLLQYLIAAYGVQYFCGLDVYKKELCYRIVPEADAAAALLDQQSLDKAMTFLLHQLFEHDDGISPLVPVLCRYGSADLIRKMIDYYWTHWTGKRKTDRYNRSEFFISFPLSDTREALVWLAQYGSFDSYLYLNDLDLGDNFGVEEIRDIFGITAPDCYPFCDEEEIIYPPEIKSFGLYLYALVRGITLDEVKDLYLYGFGLDESGKRVFDLGGVVLEAYLTQDLRIALWNATAKSSENAVPATGTDPDAITRARDEIISMRRNLKKVLNVRKKELYTDFLDAKAVEADEWRRVCARDAFLRKLASLLVWSQGKTSFTVTDDGYVNADGKNIELTDEPILIAHPMEMSPSEVTAWQKYFTSRQLKQPFLQIWTPAFHPEEIREDRYRGIALSAPELRRHRVEGIIADDYIVDTGHALHESVYIDLPGFDVKTEVFSDEGYAENHYPLEIVSIHPIDNWSRRMNACIAILDGMTIAGRIKKDDETIMMGLGSCTLAQITEYIDIAQEAKAYQVLAMLLAYKNDRFSDFDAISEFTLDDLDEPKKHRDDPLTAPTATPVNKSVDWMNGRIFVLTGFDDAAKARYTHMITSAGGTVKSSTVLATDYLVYNPHYGRETTKYKRAQELIARGKPITILTEQEFLER